MKRLGIVLLAMASCDKPQAGGPPRAAARPRVTTLQAALRPVESRIEAVGSVEPADEISIPARVGGVLDAVRFKEGDTVSASTVLAEIDVERYRLAETKAQALFDRATAQARLSETLLRNRLSLYEEGRKKDRAWVTEEQLATLRADVEKTSADVAQAGAELALAKRNRSDATVRSPISGIINRKFVAAGEFVKPETVIATILNVTPLHLRFTVPELEASRLAPGQMVEFSVRSAPGERFTAKLFHLSQKADPTTRAVEAKAEIAGVVSLRPGTYASVSAVAGRRDSVVLPERAILPTDRGFVVYVLDGAKAAPRMVKLGLRTADGVEVVEGVAAGDRVVVDGAAGLRPGTEVEVAGEAEP